MIGVLADARDHPVVREFFELFKTPWEFWQRDGRYDVLICAGDEYVRDSAAKLVLIYAGEGPPEDYQQGHARMLSYNGICIPIYGGCITFRETEIGGSLVDEGSQQPAMYVDQAGDRILARIGYDLFHEVRALLTTGQPASNAGIPALELHIAVLRDLIVASGISLVEIPPIPAGYALIACLTHDVDHPSIRQQKLGHTTFGFLY